MQHKSVKKTGFYRPRNHEASPFFQVVRDHFDEFERVYPQKYEKQYGFWRPVIRSSIDTFIKCGDVKQGFARVRCPDCKEEFFVALECGSYCTFLVTRVTFIVWTHSSAMIDELRSRVFKEILALIIGPMAHKNTVLSPLRDSSAAYAISLCQLFCRQITAFAQSCVTAPQVIGAADFIHTHPVKPLSLSRTLGVAIEYIGNFAISVVLKQSVYLLDD